MPQNSNLKASGWACQNLGLRLFLIKPENFPTTFCHTESICGFADSCLSIQRMKVYSANPSWRSMAGLYKNTVRVSLGNSSYKTVTVLTPTMPFSSIKTMSCTSWHLTQSSCNKLVVQNRELALTKHWSILLTKMNSGDGSEVTGREKEMKYQHANLWCSKLQGKHGNELLWLLKETWLLLQKSLQLSWEDESSGRGKTYVISLLRAADFQRKWNNKTKT